MGAVYVFNNKNGLFYRIFLHTLLYVIHFLHELSVIFNFPNRCVENFFTLYTKNHLCKYFAIWTYRSIIMNFIGLR